MRPINFLLLMSVLVSFAVFVSRSKTSSSSIAEETLSHVRQTGQIEAYTVVNPPFVIKNPTTGELSGICIEMMQLIAQKMNAKVNWHETTFGNAAADLASKRCDVVVTNFNATIPRALAVAFTEPPIWFMGTNAFIRKGDLRFNNVKSIYEFDKPEITVVVATGESGDNFVKENFKRAKIKRIDVESSDITRFGVEVSARRADVAISGSSTMAPYVRSHPEVVDLFGEHPFGLNPSSWAVRQDDVSWLHFLETALQFLDTQGVIANLERKYNAHVLHLVKDYKLR